MSFMWLAAVAVFTGQAMYMFASIHRRRYFFPIRTVMLLLPSDPASTM